MTKQELIALAVSMQEKAYCPYSRFPVGAALECSDGTVFTGCNVENAAFGAGICAERTALAKAVSEGHRSFLRLAVAVDSREYCTPCGICRQMLFEFAPNLELLCARAGHTFVRYSLNQLLPYGFGSATLDTGTQPD